MRAGRFRVTRVTWEVQIAVDTDRLTTGQGNRASGGRNPRIYLHIGEPKTGTTFLQESLWANRARLAAQGVQLPGYSNRDHSRASRDLRGTRRPDSDPADPWIGEWDVLAGQALRAGSRAVISNELLVASSPRQAERAVRSLLRGEVHIVVTLRDFGSLLTAEWQETVKCRGTAGWEDWLDEVVAAERAADRRRRSWFWRVHDTLAILDLWSRHLPPDQVHAVTVPRRESAGVLWTRFGSVVGIDPDGCDLTQARRNSSLGLAETEFLRRLNQALPAEMPDWFYTRELKQILAHGVLSTRPAGARLALPPGRQAWAAEQAEILIAGLRDARYDIVGDLEELRPAAGPGEPAGDGGPGDARGTEPGRQSAEQQLQAAMQAMVALAERYYQVRYPGPPLPRPARSARQRAADLTWRALNGPRLQRVLRRTSHHAAVRRLRVAIWCVLVRRRRRPG